jgi:hypothetical protein
MAIDFPSNPSLDYVFTDPTSAKSWRWDGSKWVNVTALTAADIPSASIDSTKLNVAASGSTGDVLTRNTGVTSGFAWTTPSTPSFGTFQSWTPTMTQTVNVSLSITSARYTQIGKLVTGYADVVCTSAGTAGGIIQMSLPVSPASSVRVIGVATYRATGGTDSATTLTMVRISGATTTRFVAGVASGNNYFGVSSSSPVITLASNNCFWVNFTYEAA